MSSSLGQSEKGRTHFVDLGRFASAEVAREMRESATGKSIGRRSNMGRERGTAREKKMGDGG